MSYYEQKQLQDRESHIIGAGITFFIFALPLAFVLTIFIAYPLGLSFNPVFYTLWGLLELAGIGGIAAGIKEKMERKRITSQL